MYYNHYTRGIIFFQRSIHFFYATFVNKNNRYVLCLHTIPKIDSAKRNLRQINKYDLRTYLYIYIKYLYYIIKIAHTIHA